MPFSTSTARWDMFGHVLQGKLVDQKAHKGYIELLGKVKRCNNSNTSSEVKISIRQGCADAIEIYDWEHPWLLSF
ncbi:hypothetical protein Plhal304r1_c012g0046881 [Plasmopara halstedii]